MAPKDSPASAKPPLDVAALVNRATNSKLLARQRLRELTRHHKQVEQQLRQLEARGYSAQPGKRWRGEESMSGGVASTAKEGAEAAARPGDSAGRMEIDVDGGAAPKRARRAGDAEELGAASAPAPGAQSEANARDGTTRQRPSSRVRLAFHAAYCPQTSTAPAC
jgi:hypothetical protein